MVFEVTVAAAAVCGVVHRLGKLGFIPNYGGDRQWPAWLKLVAWLHVLAGVGMVGQFDSFESGLLFGLVFVGAWKLAEEVAEVIADCVA